jgi:hypothetical protein
MVSSESPVGFWRLRLDKMRDRRERSKSRALTNVRFLELRGEEAFQG